MKLQWLLCLGYFIFGGVQLLCHGLGHGLSLAFTAQKLHFFNLSVINLENSQKELLLFSSLSFRIHIKYLSNLWFKLVLISWYCRIKLPQTWWLKTREFILSYVLGPEIWSRCGQDYIPPRRGLINFKPSESKENSNVCYDVSSLAILSWGIFHKLVSLGQNVWASLCRYFISWSLV